MKIEKDLKYTVSHEWVRLEGKTAYIGITDHAQESLGDIVFVELPRLGDNMDKGDEACTVESVTTAWSETAAMTACSEKKVTTFSMGISAWCSTVSCRTTVTIFSMAASATIF